MNIDEIVIHNNYQKLCKLIFKMLSCNSLWVINVKNSSINMLVSDRSIFKHYYDKQYYLHDPSLQVKAFKETNEPEGASKLLNKKMPWVISLGTDCDNFKECGFLYDLYKMFHIEEFVSIEKRTDTEHYCFRFFTRNNRFILINSLLNNMPIIKHFVNVWIEKSKTDFSRRPHSNLTDLKCLKNKGLVC